MKQKRKSIIVNIIIVVLFLIFAVWKFYSTTNEATKLYDKLNVEYDLLSTNDNVDNEIKVTYYPSNWRGGGFHQYITFENGEKYHINILKCVTSKDIYFGDIVGKGVRIKKRAGSDTLVVFKNENKYLFLIDVNY